MHSNNHISGDLDKSFNLGRRNSSTYSESGLSVLGIVYLIAAGTVFAAIFLPTYRAHVQHSNNQLAKKTLDSIVLKAFTEEDVRTQPIFMFHFRGPGPLPAPLENISLPDGITVSSIVRIPKFLLGPLVIVSVFHQDGSVIQQWTEFSGTRTFSKIRR